MQMHQSTSLEKSATPMIKIWDDVYEVLYEVPDADYAVIKNLRTGRQYAVTTGTQLQGSPDTCQLPRQPGVY